MIEFICHNFLKHCETKAGRKKKKGGGGSKSATEKLLFNS